MPKNYGKIMAGIGANSLMQYRTLSGAVTQVLREEIFSGKLPGGVQLKQEELAARFDVSLSAVREAIKSLEAEGLAVIYPNRGASVANLSEQEARNIFEIRMFLEMGALELSIPRLTEEDVAEAEAILVLIDGAHHTEDCNLLNWNFHKILYRRADNPKLLDQIKIMNNNVERYMRMYLVTMHYQAKSQQEHRRLLEACRNKSVKKAQNILRRHMENAAKHLAEYLHNK